jgi:hypothetical protein
MVSVFVSSVVDRGFEPGSGQIKDNTIGICWLSTKRESITRKNKDGLAPIHNNVSVWGDISIRGLLFQWASTIKIQLNKGNNKITELRTILQRESQNS